MIYDINGNALDTNTFIFSINHRGYSAEAPENTIPAFILSKKKGFTYVETDVQFTSEGVAVLLHDSTINRTARNADGSEISGTVYIANITYEQALAYDFGIWKGQQYAGTKIPTFEEFMSVCKKLSIHPFIELKDELSWTNEQVTAICDIVKKVGMENDSSFISFSSTALSRVNAIFPKMRIGFGLDGTYTSSKFNTFVSTASGLKTNDNVVNVTVNYTQMTSTYYDQLTTAGINPILWTVNDEEVALSINDTVVGVLSDALNVGAIIESQLLE